MFKMIGNKLNRLSIERLTRANIGTIFVVASVSAIIMTASMDHYLNIMRADTTEYQKLVNFGHKDLSVVFPSQVKDRYNRDVYLVYGLSGALAVLGAWLVLGKRRRKHSDTPSL